MDTQASHADAITPSIKPPRFQLRILDQRPDTLVCELLISTTTTDTLRHFAASQGLALEDLVADAMENLLEACENGTIHVGEVAD